VNTKSRWIILRYGYYNTIAFRFKCFSTRRLAFLRALRALIVLLFNLRAFFLSTMTIFPLGGGLLSENKIGATDNRAAFNIAGFGGVLGM
jgi:hypothetical protein